MNRIAGIAAGIAIAALLAAAVLSFDVYDAPSRTLALSLTFGAALGVVMQRSRFCFLCNLRDFHLRGDASGLVAILVALAVGAAGYLAVFGAWMPVVAAERLPPTAHVGPVSPALVAGALVFGFGMSVSGSCLSGHLYRLGEGSIMSLAALAGALAGFGLGFYTWNGLYLADLARGPSVWLPHHLGYGGAAAITAAGLGLLAWAILSRARPQQAAPAPAGALEAVFVRRWPPALAGTLIGLIATLAYFRVSPLGVTAEIGSLARTAASQAGILPETLYGLDGLRGCIAVVKTALLSPNGVFVGGLVAGSLASALIAGQFRPVRPNLRRTAEILVGGVLMGWGAMIALGCTVGVLLSGIHAGALAGWVFLVACVAGAYLGFAAMKRFGKPA